MFYFCISSLYFSVISIVWALLAVISIVDPWIVAVDEIGRRKLRLAD